MGGDSDVAGFHHAAICESGHTATSSMEISPDRSAAFCTVCGSKIIQQCPACGANIRGYYHVPQVLSLAEYVPPAYCHRCGTPYPWTSARLAAAADLVDEMGLGEEQQRAVKNALEKIAQDTPATPAAAARLRKLLGQATDSVGRAAWKLALDVATEAAKRIMLGG